MTARSNTVHKFRFLISIGLGLLLVMLLSGPALATLRRSAGGWLFGPKVVYTDGSGSAFFHPLSDPMPSAGILNVRVSIEMDQDTGYCKIRPALRYSADGIIWDNPAAIDTTYLTANGISYGASYVDISGSAKTWVQFGVQTANDTGGSGFQFCNASLLVEPKER